MTIQPDLLDAMRKIVASGGTLRLYDGDDLEPILFRCAEVGLVNQRMAGGSTGAEMEYTLTDQGRRALGLPIEETLREQAKGHKPGFWSWLSGLGVRA